MTGELVKKPGRPPGEKDADGKPFRVRDYPTLLISIRPDVRGRLKAMSHALRKPAWRIVEEGINLYFNAMAPNEQRTVKRAAKWIASGGTLRDLEGERVRGNATRQPRSKRKLPARVGKTQ
jgi:hypothetical protein